MSSLYDEDSTFLQTASKIIRKVNAFQSGIYRVLEVQTLIANRVELRPIGRLSYEAELLDIPLAAPV